MFLNGERNWCNDHINNPFATSHGEWGEETDWISDQCTDLSIEEDEMTWIHSNCELDAWSEEEEPIESVYTDTACNTEGARQATTPTAPPTRANAW